MARYKPYDYRQTKMLPVRFEEQILPGTFECTPRDGEKIRGLAWRVKVGPRRRIRCVSSASCSAVAADRDGSAQARRKRGASASLHSVPAPRSKRQRAAAELRSASG
jgi:hypothetical protein